MKECPKCGSAIADAAAACSCGYVFAARDAGTASTGSEGGIEIRHADGRIEGYASAAEVRTAILDGKLSRAQEARIIAPEKRGGLRAGKWFRLEKLPLTGTRDLYRPVWAHTVKGMLVGWMVGFVLKSVDSAVLYFAVNAIAGLLWIVCAGAVAVGLASSILFPKAKMQWTWGVAVAASLISIFVVGSNLYMGVLVALLLSFLGVAPLGMAVGTVVGFARRRAVPRARDARPEGARVFVLGFAAPLLFAVGFISLYVLWLNPLLIGWLTGATPATEQSAAERRGFAGAPKRVSGQPHLVIAVDATFPPMETVNERREIVGFDIDLMNAMARAADFTVEFKNTAWDGIFIGLDAGAYDAVMSGVSITDERRQTMDFSTPYVNAGRRLVVRSEDRGVTRLEDLAGKVVGAKEGVTDLSTIAHAGAIRLRLYDDIAPAFMDLMNGVTEGVICEMPEAVSFAVTDARYSGKLRLVGEPLTQEPYGVAVRKGNKAARDLIDKGLALVLDSGTYREIENKWLLDSNR